jgi:CRISPR/Cas system CSM-associated protein Csm2 small subunit
MKTAVEWLESEMLEHYSPFDNKLLYEAIHKAKEMEKEQLRKSYEKGKKYKKPLKDSNPIK